MSNVGHTKDQAGDGDSTGSTEHSFTSPTADFTLCSSDGVDFHVHEAILSDASPVFESMFADPSCKENGGRPVILVSENSQTLKTLLELCYPSKAPDLGDLARVQELMPTVDKYKLSKGVLAQIESFLRRPEFLEAEPWRVYGLACRLKLDALAKAAAAETLKKPVPDAATQGMGPELQDVSGLAMFKLICYRQKCASLIGPLISKGAEFERVYSNSKSPFRTGPHFGAPIPAHTSPFAKKQTCAACGDKSWTNAYLHVLQSAFTATPYGGALLRLDVLRAATATYCNSGCAACKERGELAPHLVECNARIAYWLDEEIAKIPFEM